MTKNPISDPKPVFKMGDRVSFLPNWRSQSPVEAKVVGIDEQFLTTEDSTGRTRRVRKGSCTPL